MPIPAPTLIDWPPPAVAPLSGDEVDLWWLPGTLAAALPRRQRTDLLLRGVLASHVGQPAPSLRFAREEKGRPYLADGGPDFNLSDTRGGTLIGVAARGRIGVDLERADRRPPASALAQRWFAADESAYLDALPDEAECARHFIRLWTAKEAACKATGTGIFGWLDQWLFDPAIDQPALRRPPDAAQAGAPWHFLRLAPAPDYTAVLAASGFRPRLRRLWQVIEATSAAPC